MTGNFWRAFGLMTVALVLIYALRPQLATGILGLFVILAAAEIFVQGGIGGK